MISIYAAANLLMAGIWVVFMPSYIALAKCNKREDCDPNFWMSAGMLVEDLWYPGTVRIAGYGAKAANRYMPNSDQNIFRPACIPCPRTFTEDTGGRAFGDTGPLQPAGVSGRAITTTLDKTTRAKCVRVPKLAINPDARLVKLIGSKGDPVSAKEYVWTQLFGKEWRAVESLIASTSSNGVSVDVDKLRQALGSSSTPYNSQLFKEGTPFPWLRMQWVKVRSGVEESSPALNMPKDFTVDGHYVVNGVPFVPPKLWHTFRRPRTKTGTRNDERQALLYPELDPNGTYLTYDFVISSQPTGDPDTKVVSNFAATAAPSKAMTDEMKNGDKYGWYFEKVGYELEWWYPGIYHPASGKTNMQTSMLAWEEEHYRDYIERFFAGGHATIAIWVPK